MKYFQLLLFLFSGLMFSQNLKKIKIVDSQDSKPISNVRLLFSNEVVYSNDDGFALIPENVKDLEISKSGYLTEKLNKVSEIISLKPLYQDIEEVKIVNIDVKKIFKEVSNRYSDIYYDKSAIYDVTIKQRAFENNDMKLLMIADGKFWSRDGSYNAKEAFSNKFDNFVQLQIDDLRYLKSKPYENFIKVKKQNQGHDYIGNLFFSYELFRLNRFIGLKKSVTTGRLIYENGDEQEISFSVKTDENLLYKGKINYNEKDKAITYYEMSFSQSKFLPEKLKDENGKEYSRQLGDGTVLFEFYKNGEKYVPSKVSVVAEGFKTITDTKTFEFRSAREIIFRNFKATEAKGVENPVEIYKSFWNKMKVSDDKGEILLSKEEEQFINEKADEE
ncbi:hypothetical protein [uncultured Chryseobacterium sp.]|uniref:hypothetical protein n=1 Tax=uncultured Chryseobacterium sp. TaxID=259322 RepID=UPI0026236DEE|nr:hypothetical protein [uncultured Chryseobacterium sp.]